MGLFGKSFEEKVTEAIASLRTKGLAVRNLAATVDGKNVTLRGEVDSPEAKGRVMQEFNALVQTDNTMNQIRVDKPVERPKVEMAAVAMPVEMPPGGFVGGPEMPEPIQAEAAPVEQIHEVVGGDTLSKLAKKYYGNGSKYMKIFDANKDQLKNPDVIKVGQKLRIPA